MVHHHYRCLQMTKNERPTEGDEESQTPVVDCGHYGLSKRRRPRALFLLLSILFWTCVLGPYFWGCSSALSRLYSFGVEIDDPFGARDANASSCSSVSDGIICCDRSNYRSDICFMKGDVRTDSASISVFVYRPRVSQSFTNVTSSIFGETEGEEEDEFQHEVVKAYTRKWETSVMDTIDELDLISKRGELAQTHQCDVRHDVPAVFFSTGGYTGNLYHEFNDGILPLYITSQHFRKKVVFIALEYHDWWIMKYGDVLSLLSDYPVIDFTGDNRTHCFPAAIVGLKIHDELTINSSMMDGHKTIKDFHDLLDQAYWPRIRGLIQDKERKKSERLLALSPSPEPQKEKQEFRSEKPNLVIISRNGSRAIVNEDLLVELAEEIGFSVRIIKPDRTTELAKIYRSLNSSDVMVGVHGAAMTHFLFMRPGSVFIQVIPLGTSWAAETYYGEPARKLGLKYIAYEILPRESSLYEEYDESDPVLTDPESVREKGWEFTKKIYLDKQNVRLDLRRFQKGLVHAYEHSIATNNKHQFPNQNSFAM